jgi:capsular polysaccharide biosynthesis protein
VNTVKDWAERHGTPYRVVIPARLGEVFRTRDAMGYCESIPVPQPEVYVAEIPDATIKGQDESVWADGEQLNDLAVRHAGRAPFTQTTLPPDGPWVGRSYQVSNRVVIPEGILLTHHFAGNWFHWIVEQVSKLQFADGIPLIVDRGLPPQCIQAVSGRTLIEVGPLPYTVKRLTVIGRLVWLPPDLLPGVRVIDSDILMAAEAIAYLRNMATLSTPNVKLYVERTGAIRLSNQAEVRAHFEAEGYVTIRPQSLTFDQQRELFGRASAIAGESGGGLTNVLFAPPECEVTILQTPIEWNLYANLVGFGGQKARFIDGVPVPMEPYYQAPYRVTL